MFTGIIETQGKIDALEVKANLMVVTLTPEVSWPDVKIGDSIAINGVCLTVTQINGDQLSFDMMKETLDKTSLSDLKFGARVNCERALLASGRVDGHFVTGHVDTVGCIVQRATQENYLALTIEIDASLAPYIAVKGSVALDGVSMTVGTVKDHQFEVYLIPLTAEKTTLGCKQVGDVVNIEVDILARYVLNGQSQGS